MTALPRLPWTIVNAFSAVCLMSAAILFMTPTEFPRTNHETVGVRIDWLNLLCTTPQPNFAITDDQVYEFWQLPKTARLSPQMDESGRCGVAVAKYNAKSSNKVDATVCYCAGKWWVVVMALISFGLSLVSLIHCIGGVLARKVPVHTIREIRAQRCSERMRYVVFALGLVAFVYNGRNPFTYTKYGDLHPSAYFDALPTSWLVGWLLFIGGNMFQTASILCFKICALCRHSRAIKLLRPNEKKSLPSSPNISTPSPDPPKLFDVAVQTSDSDSSSETSVAVRFKSTQTSPPGLFTVTVYDRPAQESDTPSSLSSIMLTAADEADQSSKSAEKNAKSDVVVVVKEMMQKPDTDDGKDTVVSKEQVECKVKDEEEAKAINPPAVIPILLGSNGSDGELKKEKAKSEVEETEQKDKKKEAAEVKEKGGKME